MTTVAAHDRNTAAEREPLDELVDMLCQVETSLDREAVRAVTAGVVRQRARQRRLAAELAEAPDVLRTGKPPAAIMVGKLLLALKKAGAEQLASPVCGVCGRELRTLTFARRTWGCSRCVSTPNLAACTECGQVRDVHARDRDGRPFCRACFVDEDVTTQLTEVVIGIPRR
ncbi:hypothetical protein ACFY9A_38760 [Streptomyces rubradiris]|uniref:hypothetical protein n=1 Tax=Streptomyces rubradiris TaxID=285531 RepID=UPI0036DFC6E2